MFIYIDNNNVAELRALTNSVTEVPDTGAAVEVTIKDAAGTEVPGQSWPAVMTHAAAATYRVTLDHGLVLVPNGVYTAFVDAIGSGGEVGHWEITVIGRTRNA